MRRACYVVLTVPSVLTLLGLICTTVAAAAQRPQRGGIRGVVTDAHQRPVAGAVVIAVQPATGYRQSTQSDINGAFQLKRLPLAATTITVSREGFARLEQHVVPKPNRPLDLPFRLIRLPLEEGDAALLETQTAEVSQTINARKIEDMPLGDRRSMNMIGITGASVFVNYESGQKPNFSLAGGRSQSQMFTIDGGNGQSMRMGGGQIDFDPPAEALSEVKVLSSGYSAEHGGSAGGVVMTKIKSGSSRFRGSLFEFLRNDAVDAANFFAPVSGEEKIKAPLRYNVFGGTLGGPVHRDRTFFFFSYEGSRRQEGSTRSLTVPTVLQRSGDFSSTLNMQGRVVAIYDPDTTRLAGTRYVRDLFPANLIPASRIDPVAAKAIGFYPLPNSATDNLTGANNFRANSSRAFRRDHYTVKLDHSLSARDKLSGRYIHDTNDQFASSIYPIAAAENQTDSLSHQHQGFAAWTRTFRPRLLNDFRFTYSNRTNHQVSKGLGGDWPSKLGLGGVPETAFPRFQPSGYSPLGAANQERRQFPIEQYQFLNTFSWSGAKHAVKLGFEYRPSRNVEMDLPNVSGSFTFNPLPSGLPGQAGTGNSLATMLVGFPTAFTQRQTETLERSSHYLAAYMQDNWAVRRNLTLNVGLRWEVDTPMVDAGNRMNGFDTAAINPVSGTPGVVRFAGVNDWPLAPYSGDWNNLGPRVGFAWRPFAAENTILRGGYGVFIAHPFDHSAASSASLGFELSARLLTRDNGITAPFYLKDGVPVYGIAEPVLDDRFGAVPAGQNPTTAVTFFESDRRSGYAHQFHLGLQRALPGQMLLDISYLGNLSRKLASANLSINQIRPELLGPLSSQTDRPFPQFSDVQVVLPSLGVSSYHAGVARLERRFSHGLQFLGTYTWSKFLNNADEGGQGAGGDSGVYSDLYNRRADWGPSDNDIRHRFTFSSIYDLPRLTHSNHWLALVSGGWSVGSIVTMQSGAPFTVNTLVNTTSAFSAGPLRADVLKNPNLLPDQRTLTRWFDTAAFMQPSLYTFGNQGVNILRGDGLVNFDFSILRSFSLSERMRLQFRGELFNALNHPNFGLPGRTLGNADFGIVDTAAPGRRVQLGLRLTF